MANFKKIVAMLLFCCAFYSNSKAQTTGDEQQKQLRQDDLARQRQEEDLNSRMKNMDALVGSGSGSRTIYAFPGANSPILSKEEREKINAILAPNVSDAAKYKDFLRQKNTGLFRLFPDLNCQKKNIIRVDGECADLVQDSWNYSFRQKNYSDADLSDIRLKDGNLTSEGFLSQGILLQLGDVPLEAVSQATSAVKVLLDFKPETQSAEVKKQFIEIAKGGSNYKYAKSVRAEENTTYALRVVAYRVQNTAIYQMSPRTSPDYFKFLRLSYGDKRTDLTIAFRIVRRDRNGGVTILWKELNRQDAPKIIFAKGERPSDIKANK